jgi:hypothetical protein
MMACLCQARPDIDPYHLRLAIQQSASQYTHPDSLLGYGIPDYAKAMLILQVGVTGKTSFWAYPNPFKDFFNISYDTNMSGNFEISLFSVTGDIVLRTNRMIVSGGGNLFNINNLGGLAPGMYILKASCGNITEYMHLVKVEK